MAIVSKSEIRDMLRRSVPRIQPKGELPNDNEAQVLKQGLRDQVNKQLKELGR